MNTFLFLNAGKPGNDFLYQPTPVGKAPPWLVAGCFSLKSPSILQSCGNCNVLQPESMYRGEEAFESSPSTNFQSSLKEMTDRCANTLVVAQRRVMIRKIF